MGHFENQERTNAAYRSMGFVNRKPSDPTHLFPSGCGKKSVGSAVRADRSLPRIKDNGAGGIRTLGTVTRTPHFQCGPFSHSDTAPTPASRPRISQSVNPDGRRLCRVPLEPRPNVRIKVFVALLTEDMLPQDSLAINDERKGSKGFNIEPLEGACVAAEQLHRVPLQMPLQVFSRFIG